MDQINLLVPSETMEKLRQVLGFRHNKRVIEEALTLLQWAALQKELGRTILSAAADGTDIEKLMLPSLATTSS